MFLKEEVRYKVADMFADLEEGTIINAFKRKVLSSGEGAK